MPHGGMLLFDRSAAHYLPGLLAELAWLTVWRLRNILDPDERWGYHRAHRIDNPATIAPGQSRQR